MSEVIYSFESNWTFAAPLHYRSIKEAKYSSTRIENNIHVDLAGHRAQMNNYIKDSRATVMNFNEWRRLLTGTKLSEQDRLKRIPMLGQSGEVYPFTSDYGNSGFLILGAEAWAEVWDTKRVQRIRLNFEGLTPTQADVESITQELAGLKWPIQEDEQVGTSNGG